MCKSACKVRVAQQSLVCSCSAGGIGLLAMCPPCWYVPTSAAACKYCTSLCCPVVFAVTHVYRLTRLAIASAAGAHYDIGRQDFVFSNQPITNTLFRCEQQGFNIHQIHRTCSFKFVL
jgi:hypothetical protein